MLVLAQRLLLLSNVCHGQSEFAEVMMVIPLRTMNVSSIGAARANRMEPVFPSSWWVGTDSYCTDGFHPPLAFTRDAK